MKRNLIFTLISCVLFALNSYGANIQGTITDKETGEPLPFVNINLLKDSAIVNGGLTDFDGNFMFKNIQPGIYIVQMSFVGYTALAVDSIVIGMKNLYTMNFQMVASTIELQEFVVVQYKQKLIDKSNTACKAVISSQEISRLPRKSKKSNKIKVRGARSDGNYYYIDGMKVSNASSSRAQIPNNEQYNKVQKSEYYSARSNPLSTFSIDVDKASYTNVRRYINSGKLPPVDAVRVEEMINYFSYNYPQPTEEFPFSISTEYTDCPWNTQHKMVHIGIQGLDVDVADAPANNLVFLIDVSGSMRSYDKLDLVKSGLNLMVDQLRSQDRVAIVVYAGAAGLVLPSTSGRHKEEIKGAINRLTAGGSTAGGAGINLAYQVALDNFIEKGNNRIILASDGDFNVGISNQSELIKLIESKRDDDVFLTVLGFGTGNIHDGMMEQIADKGNGQYNYIDNLLEAKKVFVSELGATIITIAKDVKIQVEFNTANVQGYKLIGYVNRKLADKDFNDDTKDAGEIGAGHSVTMMYEIIPAGVQTDLLNVDDLKYKKRQKSNESLGLDNELLTVKCRYKLPKGKKSMLVSEVVLNTPVPFESASENCKFSSSVASFGMLLSNKGEVQKMDFNQVADLAKKSKGLDEDGSRSEFIRLVELVALL